jgi:hypothetical protein
MQSQNIIYTAHLFPLLDEQLISLLRSLTTEEWNQPTIAKLWTVKDIASHLLDGNIRTLSLSRDQHRIEPDRAINSYQDLVDYLNQLNADWVKATKRMSPQVLTDLLEITGRQCSAYWQEIDLFADATFSVAWAGEQTSMNWFHVAREYTEKFIHQQQIREAVGKQGLLTKQFFYPFVDTFMRALPYTYRNTTAETGTTVELIVSSDIGGSWFVSKHETEWALLNKPVNEVAAQVIIDPQTAWKLFSKGITPAEARKKVTIHKNETLGEVALTMLSVMA